LRPTEVEIAKIFFDISPKLKIATIGTKFDNDFMPTSIFQRTIMVILLQGQGKVKKRAAGDSDGPQ
jgi:hypothetical protein